MIASEWIVAPVRMGFGSGPCVMGLWYQRQPLSELDALLPPNVEAVLEHRKLLSVMRRAIRTARFSVGARVVLPFLPIVPIVIEMKT